ncbi:unnamed protein product, partial [Arabidopsis halleri]
MGRVRSMKCLFQARSGFRVASGSALRRRHMCYILRYLFRANGHRHFSRERLDCRNQTLRLPDHLYQPSRPHLLPHLSQLLLVRDS